MTKITVLDAIMGSGKTTYVINMLNEAWMHDTAQRFLNPDHQNQKFLVVVPLLSEVDRITQACSNLRFKNPIPVHGQKLYDLRRLITEGENIVTTHALFKMLDRDLYQRLKDQGYTLVVDEVLDCVDLYSELTEKDRNLLFTSEMVFINPETRRLCWNYSKHGGYKGKFDQIKHLCDTGSLVSIDGKVLIWEFPSEFLKCFNQVYVCTYLFQGSPFSAYLMAEGFSVEVLSIRDGKMVPAGDNHLAVIEQIRKLITIYEGPMNGIGREEANRHPLSSSWYKKAQDQQLKKLKSSTEAYFARHAETPSRVNGWTTYSDHRKKLKGKGYSKGWIPNNAKGTNDYAHKEAMAYLCNWFVHPLLKRYFHERGVAIDEELYALSAMIQWIWRSRIRNGKPIHLFIPSERMRGLLKDWLAGELPEQRRETLRLAA